MQTNSKPARRPTGDFLRSLQYASKPAGLSPAKTPATSVAVTQSDPLGRTLAEFYAEFFNALSAAGSEPSDEQVETISEELEDFGWTLDRDDSGRWKANEVAHVEQKKGPLRAARYGIPQQYAAQRAPKGGISVAGKDYRGGQFIPADKIAKATPEEKAKLEKANKESETKSREKAEARAKKPVDLAAVRGKTTQNAMERPLRADEQKSAKASWRAIKRFHGDNAPARLAELAEQAETALAKIKGTDQRSKSAKLELQRTMSKLQYMIDIAEIPPDLPASEKSNETATATEGSPAADTVADAGADLALPGPEPVPDPATETLPPIADRLKDHLTDVYAAKLAEASSYSDQAFRAKGTARKTLEDIARQARRDADAIDPENQKMTREKIQILEEYLAGASPEDQLEAKRQKLLQSRSGITLRYKRLAQQAWQHGDRHSARIYLRQARAES